MSIYEIGYAYPSSPIADKFRHKNGCAFLRNVRTGKIEDTFGAGIEFAMDHCKNFNVNLTDESRAWAENICRERLAIKARQYKDSFDSRMDIDSEVIMLRRILN